MGRTKQQNPDQHELPLFKAPEVYIPAVKIPQPDGSILIRAGKPELVSEMVECSWAAKELNLSVRTINYQCEIGLFRTAVKPSGRPRGKWKIAREEVLARKTFRPGIN
jgi:hypothetical protein